MQQPHGQHRFPQPGPQVRPYQQPGYPGVRIFVETLPIRILEDHCVASFALLNFSDPKELTIV